METVTSMGRGIEVASTLSSLLVLTVTTRLVGAAVFAAVAAAIAASILTLTSASRATHCCAVGGIWSLSYASGVAVDCAVVLVRKCRRL